MFFAWPLLAPDEYVTEGYAFEIMALLQEWSQHLKVDPPATEVFTKFVDSSIQSTGSLPFARIPLRSGDGIEVFRREFASGLLSGRERFFEEIENYLAALKRLETADFEIYECAQIGEFTADPRSQHSL